MADNQYNDFNDYTPDEQQQAAQPEPQQPYIQQSYNQQQKTPEQAAQSLGSLSIILGLAGCCFSPLSVVGLTLAIIGAKKDKNSVVSIVGIVLCAMMILIWIYSVVMMTVNPEMMQSYWDMVNQLQNMQ